MDGLLNFFWLFFYILGTELVNVVETSRLEGGFIPYMNSTFVAFIPRKENPITFADYRPISLCNLVYKLISKVAAQLLKPFLDKYISP